MKALVTGGTGFIGRAVVRSLLERGDHVVVLARTQDAELESWGVACHKGDVANAENFLQAASGCDALFHVAARVGAWDPIPEYIRTNIIGAENAIASCLHHGIRKLVYTRTPSVVPAGNDIEGADESLPYPATKAEAERRVLSANGPDLATAALRPHLVWGPGDNHLIPRLLEQARAGRVRFIGSGDKLVDATYIDNAVDAHLLAIDPLEIGGVSAGRAYFIGQGEPTPAGEFVNAILDAAGLPPARSECPPGSRGASAQYQKRPSRCWGGRRSRSSLASRRGSSPPRTGTTSVPYVETSATHRESARPKA